MVRTSTVGVVATLLCLSYAAGAARGEDAGPGAEDARQFRRELARVEAFKASFSSGPADDLARYDKFADEIQRTWSRRNKEYYARLMLRICAPLTSGWFRGEEPYGLARRYALSALNCADEIPVSLELDLTGNVTYVMTRPNRRCWQFG